jgi:hypothetical protein
VITVTFGYYYTCCKVNIQVVSYTIVEERVGIDQVVHLDPTREAMANHQVLVF